MKDIGSDRFEALSAGVTPRGQVSPITLRILQDKFRIDASGARSKSWEEFKEEHLDFVVSVSLDQLDRLRIEVKMKNLAKSD
jgi:arsenate reductase (thioredoxin)